MTAFKRNLRRWLPPVAGVALIALFLALAAWQLDRAGQKKALTALFDESAPYENLRPDGGQPLYQRVSVRGRYLPDRQFLIDNIVKSSRVGYYVVTPLEVAPGEPLLLVNRGWIPKPDGGGEPAIGVGGEPREVRGRIGRLPRVALRPGEAIEPGQDWPRVAVYPERSDIADSLGREIAEPVLLLAPAAEDGFARQWEPDRNGPMMHYGYAFQWSALAVAVAVVLVWQLRKRRRDG